MSRPIRVLTIGHSYVVAMNRAIARKVASDPEFNITIAAPAKFHGDLRPVELEPEPDDSRARIAPLRAQLTQSIHLFRYDQAALDRLIQSGSFDVVHAWEEPYIFAGYQIARALRSSNARFCFRTAQSYVKRYPPPFHFFERKVLQRAQGWIAGASLVHTAMLQRNYPGDSGQVLNLAVDLESFRLQSPEERQNVRSELGLTEPVIGFVGRFTEAKGINVLLQAMDNILEREWSLLLLGSGESLPRITEWINQRNVSKRVRVLLAKHDQVPRYLGAMDMLLAPSQTRKNWREQFGRMIVEAFACGVPVVGSDSGEIPFVIGDAGRVVKESDIDAWSSCIADLLDDRSARSRMAVLGLERAKQFSVASSAEKYKTYYRWLSERSIV